MQTMIYQNITFKQGKIMTMDTRHGTKIQAYTETQAQAYIHK